MRRIIILYFFIFNSISLFSTNQVKDVLIYEGDTFLLYSAYKDTVKYFMGMESPLQFLGMDDLIFKEAGRDPENTSTSCYRGYIAVWIVKDSSIYLHKVIDCGNRRGPTFNPIIEKLLNKKFENGLLLADWISGGINCMMDRYSTCRKSFDDRLKLYFTNGKLTSSYRSNESYNCLLYGYENLNEFFYSKIRWNALPRLSDTTELVITWAIEIVDEFNKEDRLEYTIICSSDKRFNKEVIRIAKMLPRCSNYSTELSSMQKWYSTELRLSNTGRRKFDLRLRK